jgi:putative transposase
VKEAPEFAEHMRDADGNENSLRFWQAGGGYDRNIFTAEELWEKIKYIHENPVRRKLVTIATDWRWSSAADYAKLREGPLKVDNENLSWK